MIVIRKIYIVNFEEMYMSTYDNDTLIIKKFFMENYSKLHFKNTS